MINNLNSVLLEGTILEDPEIIVRNKIKSYNFIIVSNRYYRNNDEYQKEVSHFEVISYSQFDSFRILLKGDHIRLVGSIRQINYKDKFDRELNKVVVIADHIELKPEHKDPQ